MTEVKRARRQYSKGVCDPHLMQHKILDWVDVSVQGQVKIKIARVRSLRFGDCKTFCPIGQSLADIDTLRGTIGEAKHKVGRAKLKVGGAAAYHMYRKLRSV